MTSYSGNKIDSDLVAANLKKGKEIFGVTGTFYGINEICVSHKPCVGVEGDASGTPANNSANAQGYIRFYDPGGSNAYHLWTVVTLQVIGASSPYRQYQTITFGTVDKTTGLITLVDSVGESIGSSANQMFALTTNGTGTYVIETAETGGVTGTSATRNGTALSLGGSAQSTSLTGSATTTITVNGITYAYGNVYENHRDDNATTDVVAGAAFITLQLS